MECCCLNNLSYNDLDNLTVKYPSLDYVHNTGSANLTYHTNTTLATIPLINCSNRYYLILGMGMSNSSVDTDLDATIQLSFSGNVSRICYGRAKVPFIQNIGAMLYSVILISSNSVNVNLVGNTDYNGGSTVSFTGYLLSLRLS